MTEPLKTKKELDPSFRAKLLRESKTPWRGLRKLLWFALFGSAVLGLFIMAMRFVSGQDVPFSDAGIQSLAVLIFGYLIIADRDKNNYD